MSEAWYIVEIHHSGRKPSIFKGENSAIYDFVKYTIYLVLCQDPYEPISFKPAVMPDTTKV